MFTGIIRAQAKVVRAEARGRGREILVAPVPATWSSRVGDSIAVDGICLTVERLTADGVVFYLSQETLACTTANEWQAGRALHLEPALKLGERLDGHIVQGHVDAVGQVHSRHNIGEDLVIAFTYPPQLVPMLFAKGSITVDGVSLTINRVCDERFEVNLIPHTQRETHLASLRLGQRVNLETDPIARQVAAVIVRLNLVEKHQ